MHICTVIKEKVQSLQTEQNKYVLKQALDDDSDVAHLASLEYNSRQKKKQKKKSDHHVLPCCVQVY